MAHWKLFWLVTTHTSPNKTTLSQHRMFWRIIVKLIRWYYNDSINYVYVYFQNRRYSIVACHVYRHRKCVVVRPLQIGTILLNIMEWYYSFMITSKRAGAYLNIPTDVVSSEYISIDAAILLRKFVRSPCKIRQLPQQDCSRYHCQMSQRSDHLNHQYRRFET